MSAGTAVGAAGTDGRTSVVIITCDRQAELAHTLRRLADIPERPPIVVVDNGSCDSTVAMVRRDFPAVTVLALPVNAGAVGRNIGVAHCRTPYVAFCDDDTWWEPGSLALAADTLDRHPALAVVTARILIEPGGGEDPICAELAGSPIPVAAGAPGPALLSFLAGASVVRRRAFLGAGGFSRRLFIGGEEELLGADLVETGWSMAYLAGATVHHRASRQRDAHLRRRQGIRNTLWYTWMRRPLGDAARRTAAQLQRVPRDRTTLLGCADALAGAAGVVRDRQVLSAAGAARSRLLDPSQLGSRARRYVS